MIALIAAVGLAFLVALTLLRLFLGPTLYDRALAVNSLVLKAALMCGAIAVLLSDPRAVDVAFMLALGGFVLAAAVLKFFRARTFQAPLARAEERL